MISLIESYKSSIKTNWVSTRCCF